MPVSVGVTSSLPPADLVPLQAPPAVQLAPFVVQVSVALCPRVMVVGSTESDRVAGGFESPPPP